MNLLKETVEETKEELYVSADTDAKVGRKSTDSAFFGKRKYKTGQQKRSKRKKEFQSRIETQSGDYDGKQERQRCLYV